jgi:hypothetical protein
MNAMPLSPLANGLESWRVVWRSGFAPLISTAGLLALRRALTADDPCILQGATTSPPSMMSVENWPVDGTDAIGFTGWKGEGLDTVGEVQEYFARLCHEADIRLGEAAACRYFLNWYDDTPRDAMRRELLAELALTLSQRILPDEGSTDSV